MLAVPSLRNVLLRLSVCNDMLDFMLWHDNFPALPLYLTEVISAELLFAPTYRIVSYRVVVLRGAVIGRDSNVSLRCS